VERCGCRAWGSSIRVGVPSTFGWSHGGKWDAELQAYLAVSRLVRRNLLTTRARGLVAGFAAPVDPFPENPSAPLGLLRVVLPLHDAALQVDSEFEDELPGVHAAVSSMNVAKVAPERRCAAPA
jgi:hypothetical protein